MACSKGTRPAQDIQARQAQRGGGAPRRRRRDRCRRDGRDHGAVGIRQEHADAHPGPAPRPRPRRRPAPELTFDGRDMVDLGDGERTRIRAREMGFVFQDFNLIPTLTALENVMLACDYAGIDGRDAPGGDARGARARRARRPGEPPAIGAVRRRAAAGGDRPGARQRAAAGPRRRADRQPRFGAVRRGARGCSGDSIASAARHSSS